MIKQIVGGAIATLVIGGTAYTVSQADVTNNFANNTGMSQQQAQQYVNNIKPSDLESFSKVGQDLLDDSNSIQNTMSQIDCVNYSYQWETPALSCSDAKTQLQSISSDEFILGNCYQSLGTDLGNAASSTMNECISDIDTVDSDYGLPIATTILDSKTLTDAKNANIYNKSVLQAALKSN